MRGVACQRVRYLQNDFEYLMACARDRDYSSTNLLHEATGNGQKLKATTEQRPTKKQKTIHVDEYCDTKP